MKVVKVKDDTNPIEATARDRGDVRVVVDTCGEEEKNQFTRRVQQELSNGN